MASLEERRTSAGITYRIKWRQDGVTQSETFPATRRRAAERFLLDVEDNNHRWPEGWIKGHGYPDAPSVPDAAQEPQRAETAFLAYALMHVRDKTGIQPDTRTRYAHQVTVLAEELDAIVAADPESDAGSASLSNLTHRHIARWINARENSGASPKTIANWHGLLFQIMEAAVQDGMRPTNPCATTGKSLPRRDAQRTDEVHTHLTEAEFALIARAMWPGLPDPANGGIVTAIGTVHDRRLLVVAIGTGARWGELTALTVGDCTLDTGCPTVRVERAWKANGTGEYARPDVGRRYVGPPKTRRGRRQVRVGAVVVEALKAQIAGRGLGELLFTGTRGGPVDQPHWYEYRWQRAVALAQRNGLTKSPRFHDLRSSYVGWLMTGNVPLPEIQRRLGHESIVTTIDVYGGLLQQAGDVADRVIDAALESQTEDDEPDEGAQAS